MPIPDYQSVMLPLLQLAGDGETHKFRATVEALARNYDLTDEERRDLLPSGKQPIFDNRVGWARTYLGKAGLLESPKRGQFRITDRGRQVLAQPPPSIDVQFLLQFEEFVVFKQRRTEKSATKAEDSQSTPRDESPEELLESAHQILRDDLATEILALTKAGSAAFFEQLVVDLIVRMGYGGSRKEAGQAVGGSGDEGIDGIIKEDRLGLDIIYLQAKRWENTVGRPEVQKFAGALQGQRAKKGILITTSTFSRNAKDYVTNIDPKIILIDGQSLVDFMIDHGLGVTTEATFELKRVDSDYFSEE